MLPIISLQNGIYDEDVIQEFCGQISPVDFFNEREYPDSKVSDFEKFLNSEGFCKSREFTIKKSPADILLMILKFCVSNSLTLKAICDLLKLFNNLVSENVLPDNKHFVNKYFNPHNAAEYHGICSNENCGAYLGKLSDFNNNVTCPVCGEEEKISRSSYKSFFVIIDPTESIKRVINRYDDFYHNAVSGNYGEPGKFCDIFDGKRHKNLVSSLPEDQKNSYVSCLFNTDGASKFFRSSSGSSWPLYIMINEIPITARFRNIITCGLYFGKKKPNMLIYLKPFVELFNKKLSTVGVDCIIRGTIKNLKVYCIGCVLDSPARAPVQGMKQYSGNYSCNWCLIPGKIIDTCRFSFLNFESYPRRDHNSTIKAMKALANTGKSTPNTGVNNVSALINLHFFDIIESFSLDSFHAGIIGVGLQCSNLILRTLSKSQLQLIGDLILKIKVPHQLCRLTRSITERNLWKGKEWEAWILYYSLPILSKVADKTLVEYWSLFVRSLFICLKISISHEELLSAREMLYEFGIRTETYFGIYEASYNLHIIVEHLVDNVINLGPAFCSSAYPFEASNRHFLRAIKSAVGVNVQILRYLNLSQTILELEKRLMPEASEIFLNYYEEIGTIDSFSIGNNHYFGSTGFNSEEINYVLNYFQFSGFDNESLSDEIFSCYLRLLKKDYLYRSCMPICKRTDSSFAKLKNGQAVRIFKFIIDNNSRSEYILCKFLSVKENSIVSDYTPLLEILTISEDLDIISTDDLLNVCIYLEIDNVKYICDLPNPYSLYA